VSRLKLLPNFIGQSKDNKFSGLNDKNSNLKSTWSAWATLERFSQQLDTTWVIYWSTSWRKAGDWAWEASLVDLENHYLLDDSNQMMNISGRFAIKKLKYLPVALVAWDVQNPRDFCLRRPRAEDWKVDDEIWGKPPRTQRTALDIQRLADKFVRSHPDRNQ